MEQQLQQVSLNDLRNGSSSINDSFNLEKNMFGGYKKKAVLEYIKMLRENLQNAERSFNNRLEEYASASSMLTQERDKYMKILQNIEEANLQTQHKIRELTQENESLNLKISELSENALDESEVEKYKEVLTQNDEMKKAIEAMEDKAKVYEEDNLSLTKNIDSLELTVRDLNEQLESATKNEKFKNEYDALASENELVKEQFDEAMSENSILLAEKNMLAEQNRRISDELAELSEKNKELRDENTKLKLSTRKMAAQFEAKIYECSQTHKQNIEQISDNIKNVINIINYEKLDITKRLSTSEEDMDLEGEIEDDVQVES